MLEGQIFEAADDVGAAEREGDFESEAFAREIVNEVHRADSLVIGEPILHEVDRLARFGACTGAMALPRT